MRGLDGGSGNDTLNGGNGTDTAVFSDQDNYIDLSITTRYDTGDGNDLLISIENANAGGGNNTIVGNSASNRFTGGSGNDSFIGKEGNDFLTGGEGDDILNGGDGIDYAYFYGLSLIHISEPTRPY